MKSTIRTYGRHRQRVIAADIWSSGDEKKKHVFSFSTSNSDSQDSSTFSNDSGQQRPKRTGKKSGKVSKENRYNKKKPPAKKLTRKRQKSVHIYSDNKSSESSSCSDRFLSSVEAPNPRRRALRDRNNFNYSESQRNNELCRLAQRNNRKKKDDKENSGMNFSEFDEYSLLISDSSMKKGEKSVVDSLLKSPFVSAIGKGKDSNIGINVETSTPFGRQRRRNITSKITTHDISQIEAVESPPADLSHSSNLDLDSLHIRNDKPNSGKEFNLVNSLSPSIFSLSSIGDIHESLKSPYCNKDTETVPENVISTKECQIQLERLSQSLFQKLHGAIPMDKSIDDLKSAMQIPNYSNNSRSLFDSIEESSVIEESYEDVEDGGFEEEVEVEERDEEDEEDEEEEGSSDSSLSDIQENSEDDVEESGDINVESSGADSDNVSRYTLADNFSNCKWGNDSSDSTSCRTSDNTNVYHTAESTSGSSASFITANRSCMDSQYFSSPQKSCLNHSCQENLENSFAQILTPNGKSKTKIALSPKTKVFQVCDQHQPVSFTECIPRNLLNTCVKIGEGVYGEVFRAERNKTSVAIKIIPIEGDFPVNDEPQKTFEEILPEIVITSELSALRNFADNNTDNFIEVNSVSCVRGRYPDLLLKQWDLYDEARDSQNDRPDIFGDRQLFIGFEFADGGCDLESYKLRNVLEAKSVLQQVTYSLAVAEQELEFEHRDLHWGNVLVRQTHKPVISYTINGEAYHVDSNGVEVSIIDFTLSRLRKDGCTVYCDLAKDKTLFEGKGDYQFDIYRMMKESNNNLWEPFNPHTNVQWLHYLADKLVKEKRYPQSRAARDVLREFRQFINDCLSYVSARHLVLESDFIKL